MKYPIRINEIPLDSQSNTIWIHAFRPKDNLGLCHEFQCDQKRIFEKQFESGKISSLDESWMEDENVYLICAFCKEEKTLLGGFRIHIYNEAHSLPIETAIGLEEPRIYELVEELGVKGVVELCALWISSRGIKAGLKAFDLIRGVISVCHQLNIENVLSLAGPNSRRFTQYYNAIQYEDFGQEGIFYYPTPKVKCVVTNVPISNVFQKVPLFEKNILKDLFDNPRISISKADPIPCPYIQYDLKI